MKIAGFFGFKGSGKDEAAKVLIRNGFVKFAFADSIKDMLSQIFIWDRNMLDGTSPESRAWREIPDPWWAKRLNIPHFTPRFAMTSLGTDVIRKHFHQDVWLASLEKKMWDSGAGKIVITDIRHTHEITMINSLNVGYKPILSHIVRGELPSYWPETAGLTSNYNCIPEYMATTHPNIHISEWEWNRYAYCNAVRIDNDGDIPALERKVETVYGDISWI